VAERISRRLVLLSSAAIGAVYLAGYLDTRSADASLTNTTTSVTTSGAASTAAAPDTAIAQAETATQAATSAVTSTSTSKSTSSASAASSSQRAAAPPTAVMPPAAVPPTATAKPAATATAVPTGLRDGTYTGVGNSRRGGIQAAVTVKAGRITNVAITGASTQYPVAWISALPGEVVADQSAQVDLVSGATYSSLAFQGAVQQALAQAQA
jgi:uncharacterized protein with FMN-binding domain